jgi:hypothetical protein
MIEMIAADKDFFCSPEEGGIVVRRRRLGDPGRNGFPVDKDIPDNPADGVLCLLHTLFHVDVLECNLP